MSDATALRILLIGSLLGVVAFAGLAFVAREPGLGTSSPSPRAQPAPLATSNDDESGQPEAGGPRAEADRAGTVPAPDPANDDPPPVAAPEGVDDQTASHLAPITSEPPPAMPPPLAATPAAREVRQRENSTASVGINLAELTFYSTEYPFVDAFKLSAPFLHQADGRWTVETPMELRNDGYPARLAAGHFAGTLIFRDIDQFPSGTYTCLYDGEGDIEFDYAAQVLERAPGRIKVAVRNDPGGIYLTIRRTDPEDPVRNIRLLMPGIESEEPDAPFHPDFLDRWRGVSTLRFMDWMRTNDSNTVTWDERTRPDGQTQAGPRGVAPEYIAQLCNTLDADAWVCIPHRANDGYVRGLAELLAEQLEPQRKVYLEYSNETWNNQFSQAQWCREQGMKLALSHDPFVAQLSYHSRRAVEIFAVFGEAFPRARTVRVLAAQSGNPWTGEQILGHEDAHRYADALAIAPYFGLDVGDMERARSIARLSVGEVLDRCARQIERTLTHARDHHRHARRHRLALLAYEGGQHLVGHGGAENHEPLATLFQAANRHARMGDLYQRYIVEWRALGGGALCLFNSTGSYSKWGSWGLCEHYGPDSAESPKFRAVSRFLPR